MPTLASRVASRRVLDDRCQSFAPGSPSRLVLDERCHSFGNEALATEVSEGETEVTERGRLRRYWRDAREGRTEDPETSRVGEGGSAALHLPPCSLR